MSTQDVDIDALIRGQRRPRRWALLLLIIVIAVAAVAAWYFTRDTEEEVVFEPQRLTATQRPADDHRGVVRLGERGAELCAELCRRRRGRGSSGRDWRRSQDRRSAGAAGRQQRRTSTGDRAGAAGNCQTQTRGVAGEPGRLRDCGLGTCSGNCPRAGRQRDPRARTDR